MHDPAKVLLELAVALVLGVDCLADVAVLRAERVGTLASALHWRVGGASFPRM